MSIATARIAIFDRDQQISLCRKERMLIQRRDRMFGGKGANAL